MRKNNEAINMKANIDSFYCKHKTVCDENKNFDNTAQTMTRQKNI